MRQWTTLHKYIWLRAYQIASAVYETIKGAIVSFVTKRAAPLTELKVEFSPVQDLHGYDAPWPAGGGKNLFPPNADIHKPSWYTGNWSGTTLEADGIRQTKTSAAGGAGGFVIGPVKAGTYTFSATVDGSGDSYRINWGYTTDGENYSTLGTITPSISGTRISASFTLAKDALQIDVRPMPFHFNEGYTSTLFSKIQIESGSSASAWSPYENLCPISGWTRVKLMVWDSNVPATTKSATYESAVSKEAFVVYLGIPGGYIGVKGGLLAAPGTNFNPATDELTYETATAHASDPNGKWFVKEHSQIPGATGDWKGYTWRKTSVSIGDVWYIRPFVFVNDSNGEEQKWYGKTMAFTVGTDYDSGIDFSTWTKSITLGSTVYGGTVDVVTGVVPVDYVGVVFDGTEEGWSFGNTNPNGTIFKIDNVESNFKPYSTNRFNTQNTMCSAFKQSDKKAPDQSAMSNGLYFYTTTGKNFRFCYGLPNNGTTLAEWKAWLAEHPLTVLAESNTPVTIQLTPQEVSSLLGENNVWSDANGDLTVTYRSN